MSVDAYRVCSGDRKLLPPLLKIEFARDESRKRVGAGITNPHSAVWSDGRIVGRPVPRRGFRRRTPATHQQWQAGARFLQLGCVVLYEKRIRNRFFIHDEIVYFQVNRSGNRSEVLPEVFADGLLLL